MRLATFVAPGADPPRAGEVRDDRVVAFETGTVLERLTNGDREPAGGESFALADVTLLAPVARPRAIFGIGLNYAKHARETGKELPAVPIVFMSCPARALPRAGRCAARTSYDGSTTRWSSCS